MPRAWQVNLKKSMKFFQRSHPKAAELVGVTREMHALDLLCYHHDNNIACLWSLPTMNLYLVSREGLSYEEYHTLTYMWHHWLWQFWYVYALGTWCNPFIFLPSQLRPHGKFLVLSKDDDNNSRFLLGREVLLLMGLPINRMAGIEESSDKVLCMN